MDTTGRTSLHTVTAVVTGLTALTAYAGVVGLIGGGISFGAAVDARLPFGSLWLGGLALLVVVAAPMSVASVAAWRARPRAPDVVVGAGIALVAWIGIELAFIQVYSWFHPVYLAVAVLVLGLGWLLARRPAANRRPAPELQRQG